MGDDRYLLKFHWILDCLTIIMRSFQKFQQYINILDSHSNLASDELIHINTSIVKSDFKFYPSRVKVDLLLM